MCCQSLARPPFAGLVDGLDLLSAEHLAGLEVLGLLVALRDEVLQVPRPRPVVSDRL